MVQAEKQLKGVDLVKKGILVLVVATMVVCLLSGLVMASPSFLGVSGNVLTPNDEVLGTGDFTATIQSLQLRHGITVIGANAGLTDNLELGIANYNPSNAGSKSETIFNVKYSVLKEKGSMPSLTVGLVDATGAISVNGNPGFFAVAGKNLTRVGADVTGRPIGNLRGYLGVGTGIYNGLFVAADYSVSSRVNVVAELIGGMRMQDGINENAVFNAAVKVKITDNIGVDLALLNGSDMGFGITYTKTGL